MFVCFYHLYVYINKHNIWIDVIGLACAFVYVCCCQVLASLVDAYYFVCVVIFVCYLYVI